MSAYFRDTAEINDAFPPRYHKIPARDPQTLPEDDIEHELETLETSKPRSASSSPESEGRALWWITVGLVINVVILAVNLYLSSSIASEVASLKERPLSELPRPDPLYGATSPG